MSTMTRKAAVINWRAWVVFGAMSASMFSGELESAELKLLEARRIWDAAPHNAFTDLARHEGKWFCAFREGSRHVSPDGALRILTSEDGQEWKSAALVKDERGDLRDPKLSITPENELMLLGAVAVRDSKGVKHRNLAWFSRDGKDWSEPVEVGEENIWLWKVTWEGEHCYGVGYSTDKRDFVRLYRGDGRNFEVLAPELFSKAKTGLGYPNESALLFTPEGVGYCLLRRDADSNSAQLGEARPPYTEWTWKDLGVRIGGPELLRLPDGRILAAVRLHEGKVRTSLAWLDVEKGELKEALKLPSGGDTSYPGLVFADGIVWVSYYSSHEGKTAIYLARVAVED